METPQLVENQHILKRKDIMFKKIYPEKVLKTLTNLVGSFLQNVRGIWKNAHPPLLSRHHAVVIAVVGVEIGITIEVQVMIVRDIIAVATAMNITTITIAIVIVIEIGTVATVATTTTMTGR